MRFGTYWQARNVRSAGCYLLYPMLKTGIYVLMVVSLTATANAQSFTPRLLVANQGDRTISIVDPASSGQVGVVHENVPDGWVHELATSPDGSTAYTPVYGNSGVGKPGSDGHKMLVIDIASGKISGEVDFGKGVRPHCVVYDPNSGLLYVTTELAKSVTAVDPKSLKVVGEIPTGQAESHMLAISHDGKRGYTANVGPGTVSVLDMVGRKTVAVVPIPANTQRISISNDDRMVFTADQTKPQLAVIDTKANKVTHWITLPSLGYGSTATKDGRWLLVALPSANKIGVVDLKALKLARTVDVCQSPQEIIAPNDETAYVSCMGSGQVAGIDLRQWKSTKIIDVGSGADGLAWAK